MSGLRESQREQSVTYVCLDKWNAIHDECVFIANSLLSTCHTISLCILPSELHCIADVELPRCVMQCKKSKMLTNISWDYSGSGGTNALWPFLRNLAGEKHQSMRKILMNIR